MARIIVLFPGSLGDFICFLPTLQKIGTMQDDIVVVGRAITRAVLRTLICFPPAISLQTASLDDARFAPLFGSSYSEREEDLARFFLHATTVLSWSGFSLPEFKQNVEVYLPGHVHVFPFFSGQTESHASAYYLNCLEGIMKGSSDTQAAKPVESLPIQITEKWQQWGASYWRERKWESNQILVMHPGSGGQKKRWVSEGFAQIARWWRGQPGREVVILLGPAEEMEKEYWCSFGCVETSLELPEVASILNRATYYVGNDSGVSHLAGAVGARGAVIFGPTRPEQWRPLGGSLKAIKNSQYRNMWPERVGISLEEVTPEYVQAWLP